MANEWTAACMALRLRRGACARWMHRSMGKDTDIEFMLAMAEQQSMRAAQRHREKQREERRQRELQRRQELKREISEIRWRATT